MIPKKHREFHELDMHEGWEVPDGYPDGIKQKILSGRLDEVEKKGSRTRLVKIDPGTYTTEPFEHDYWEEVFVYEGSLRVGNGPDGEGGTLFNAPTYAVRPPGALHGPISTETGCSLFEIHYYD